MFKPNIILFYFKLRYDFINYLLPSAHTLPLSTEQMARLTRSSIHSIRPMPRLIWRLSIDMDLFCEVICMLAQTTEQLSVGCIIPMNLIFESIQWLIQKSMNWFDHDESICYPISPKSTVRKLVYFEIVEIAFKD